MTDEIIVPSSSLHCLALSMLVWSAGLVQDSSGCVATYELSLVPWECSWADHTYPCNSSDLDRHHYSYPRVLIFPRSFIPVLWPPNPNKISSSPLVSCQSLSFSVGLGDLISPSALSTVTANNVWHNLLFSLANSSITCDLTLLKVLLKEI